MADQKKLPLKPIKVRITWRQEVIFEVPPGQSPDDVWGSINLGDLDTAKQKGTILYHDYCEVISSEAWNQRGYLVDINIEDDAADIREELFND